MGIYFPDDIKIIFKLLEINVEMSKVETRKFEIRKKRHNKAKIITFIFVFDMSIIYVNMFIN